MAGEMALEYGVANALAQLSAMELGLQHRFSVEQVEAAIAQGIAEQGISKGMSAAGMGPTSSLYLGTALDTLAGAGLASLIEGNNTSADQLAAQMLGSIIGAEIAKPAVKAIKEYKAGQAELAAERKAQLQMEAPSPDLTTNQLTNYYNQNQDQYMTGGNTSSSAAENSTSQSSLNSGASGEKLSISQKCIKIIENTKVPIFPHMFLYQ